MIVDPHLQRFQEKHFQNLKEKTIAKNKIILGVINPIHTTAQIQEQKISQQCQIKSIPKNIVTSDQNPALKELEINADAAKIYQSEQVFLSDKDKPSLGENLEHPFVYQTLIYQKKSKEDELQKQLDQEKQMKQQAQQKLALQNQGKDKQSFMDRNYYTSLQQKQKKQAVEQPFWNSSINLKSFQNVNKRAILNNPTFQEIAQQIISMKLEERLEMQHKEIEKTNQIADFFTVIRSLIKKKQYIQNIPLPQKESYDLQLPKLKVIWNEYLSKFMLDFSRRTDQIFVDKEEFQNFIFALGFDPVNKSDIDQFFNNVFDKRRMQEYNLPKYASPLDYQRKKEQNIKIFENVEKAEKALQPSQAQESYVQSDKSIDDSVSQVNSETSKAVIGAAALKRIEEAISMKAFFYNYEKFFKSKKNIKGIFSKSTAKKFNVDIRDNLKPWKVDDYKRLKINLSELKQYEKSAVQYITQLEPEMGGKLEQMRKARNQLIRQKRIIANNLYNKLKDKMPSLDGMNAEFVSKVLTVSQDLALMNDFVEGFKQYVVIIQQKDPSFRKDTFNLLDFIKYIQYGKYNSIEIETIKEYITQVYAFKKVELNSTGIKPEDFTQYFQHFEKRKKKSYEYYKQFLQLIDGKYQKQSGRHAIIRQQKIESNVVELYEAGRKRQNPTVQQLVKEKENINISGFIILKALKKMDNAIMMYFYIISSIVKLIVENNKQSEKAKFSPSQMQVRVQQIIQSQRYPPTFNMKYIFSDILLLIERGEPDQSHSDQNQKQPTQNPSGNLDKAVQLFAAQSQKLNDVLYDWTQHLNEPIKISGDEDNQGKIIDVRKDKKSQQKSGKIKKSALKNTSTQKPNQQSTSQISQKQQQNSQKDNIFQQLQQISSDNQKSIQKNLEQQKQIEQQRLDEEQKEKELKIQQAFIIQQQNEEKQLAIMEQNKKAAEMQKQIQKEQINQQKKEIQQTKQQAQQAETNPIKQQIVEEPQKQKILQPDLFKKPAQEDQLIKSTTQQKKEEEKQQQLQQLFKKKDNTSKPVQIEQISSSNVRQDKPASQSEAINILSMLDDSASENPLQQQQQNKYQRPDFGQKEMEDHPIFGQSPKTNNLTQQQNQSFPSEMENQFEDFKDSNQIPPQNNQQQQLQAMIQQQQQQYNEQLLEMQRQAQQQELELQQQQLYQQQQQKLQEYQQQQQQMLQNQQQNFQQQVQRVKPGEVDEHALMTRYYGEPYSPHSSQDNKSVGTFSVESTFDGKSRVLDERMRYINCAYDDLINMVTDIKSHYYL